MKADTFKKNFHLDRIQKNKKQTLYKSIEN